jgi:hypothetical protein
MNKRCFHRWLRRFCKLIFACTCHKHTNDGCKYCEIKDYYTTDTYETIR